MTIDGVRADNSSRMYSTEPEEAKCSQDKQTPTKANEPKASILDAWDRMETSYTPGSDATCRMNRDDFQTVAPVASEDKSCECPEPPKSPAKKPAETYEQCINREAYEASKTGRWAGAAAGCATGAAAVVPSGPVGMGIACLTAGVGGYYSGGTAGASMGTTDAKVECDELDKAGSPSANALKEMNTSAFQAPIKG